MDQNAPAMEQGFATEGIAAIIDREAIVTHFQPILSLKRSAVLGFEALRRAVGKEGLIAPAARFNAARLTGKTVVLDRLCRKKAIRQFHHLEAGGRDGSPPLLFLNFDTALLDQGGAGSGFLRRQVASQNHFFLVMFTGLKRYVTDSYISWATGNLSRTISSAFRAATGGHCVPCIDVRAGDAFDQEICGEITYQEAAARQTPSIRTAPARKKLYIIKTGSTYSATARQLGDFERWTAEALGEAAFAISVVDATASQPLPPADECAGVVITGSHAMVTDNLSWSLAIESWIPSLIAAEVPLLGICYGHQLLAKAMDGRVGYHRDGEEIGTVAVERLAAGGDDPLFSSLPNVFPAQVCHSQTVLALPPGAVLLARNDHEPHHAFRLGRCAWGVQFHPEYSAAVMRAYLEEQASDLTKAGRDVAALMKAVQETPLAEGIMRQFSRLVETRLA